MRLLGFAAVASSAFLPTVAMLVLIALGVGFVAGIAYALHEVGLEQERRS